MPEESIINNELGIKSDVSPDQIELNEREIEAMDSIFNDLKASLAKQNQLNMTLQQVQNAIMQNNSDLAGNAKAADIFIKTMVSTKDCIGHYTYDTEKKVLVLDKIKQH